MSYIIFKLRGRGAPPVTTNSNTQYVTTNGGANRVVVARNP